MDGKKKKGKKKKGNQNKHSGSISTTVRINQIKPDDSVSNAEEIPSDNYHDYDPEQNHQSEAPSYADSQNIRVSASDVEQEMHKTLEAKYVDLQDKVNKLEVENDTRLEKVTCLEERIKILQNEVNYCIQKEASLEEKMDDLQSKNTLLTMRESSIKEVVSKLGDANEWLQMQVMELKEFRDNLAEENKQLNVCISTMESHIQQLEMAAFYSSSEINGEAKPHYKATDVSVKADILNEDPSEIPEMHVEPLQLSTAAEISTNEKPIKPSVEKSTTSTDHKPELQKSILETTKNMNGIPKCEENCFINGFKDSVFVEQSQQILGLDVSRESEDAVPVPLDDIIQELQPTVKKVDADLAVPFSDAPLIGAPFRLISFVAKYVSGADLVDRDKLKADR